MKKQKSFILFCLLTLCVLLVGCKKPAVETVLSSAKLGDESVTITFWHCCSATDGELLNQFVADFNANNKYKITVVPVYQGQYSDATRVLNTVLYAENYSALPDVMQLDATGKDAYYNSGKAFTVDDAAKVLGGDISDYFASAMSNWKFSGTQLGLPFASSTTITYYNKDLLSAAGWHRCPSTFAELAQLACDMKDAGLGADAFAGVPNTPTLANWIGQLGSYVVNNENGSESEATKVVCLENGALAQFLSDWMSMYKKGGVNASYDATRNDFISGKVAIYTESTSKLSSIISSVTDFSVGTADFLRVNDSATYGATMSGSCVVMFDNDSDIKKQAAWEFVKYLTGPEVQAIYASQTGYIPACESAINSDVYQSFLQSTPQAAVALDQIKKTPSFMKSVTVPSTATYDFYTSIQSFVKSLYKQSEFDANKSAYELSDILQALLDDASSLK